MPRFTLRQLEYLVVASDAGSVAGAAVKLNVSQPSISTAIAKLEGVLGVQLFVRHHALGISLTPAGQKLINEARNLLRHSQEIERQAQQAGNKIAGSLQLASFNTLGPAILPGLIVGFKNLYPEVSLAISEATQNDLIKGLRQSVFEQALIYAVDVPCDIHTVPLAEIAPHVLLPEGHELAEKKAIALEELATRNLILLDVPPSRDYFLGLFRTVGIEPKVTFCSPSLELVRGLVGRGLGYSILVTRPHGDMTYDARNSLSARLPASTNRAASPWPVRLFVACW